MMRVLHISTYDTRGGAAQAAYRLHNGLTELGISSQMLVQEKVDPSESVCSVRGKIYRPIVRISRYLDRIPLLLYADRRKCLFSLGWFYNWLDKQVQRIKPDIVNLHWIADGFLPIRSIPKIKCPIVWTLHDTWAFTGGCHYTGSCLSFQELCGVCPQLNSKRRRDLSWWILNQKKKYWETKTLTIVTPSRWLSKYAKSSSLFRDAQIEIIPNGLDTKTYRPIEKNTAKEMIGCPRDVKIILMGAVKSTTDLRKGFQYLQPSLRQLTSMHISKTIELYIFGAEAPSQQPEMGFRTHYLGQLDNEKSLGLVYSAADVFVCPSVEDNLPNTVMESLACGTPCVAFRIGGIPDMVEHEKTGYLAKPFETNDLAQGIAWVIENEERRKVLSEQARTKVENEFRLEIVARKYAELYEDVLKRPKTNVW